MVKSSLLKATLGAACVVLLAVFATAPAQAAASLDSRLAVGQTIHQTVQLQVNCQTVPHTAQAQQFLKDHSLCGLSKNGVQPLGSVSGDCGTLSNDVSNLGGGNACIHVRITTNWYIGPIYTAYWSGYTKNEGTDSYLYPDAYLPGPYGYSVDNYQNLHTDTGVVDFWVTYAQDANYVGVQCYIEAPIEAQVRITA